MNYFCLGILYFLCGGDLKLDAQTGYKLWLQSNSVVVNLFYFRVTHYKYITTLHHYCDNFLKLKQATIQILERL